jgi:phosphatidylglycerophosphatase A
MKFLARFLATTFGTGYFPVAPGTIGALFILIIYYFLPPISPAIFLFATLVIFIIGTWAATETEKAYGHDASQINIDEVVGMLLTLFLVEKTWLALLLGFILFRFFDIVKPFPINKMQDFPRGWGVMLDDVLAGIFGNILLHLILLGIKTFA